MTEPAIPPQPESPPASAAPAPTPLPKDELLFEWEVPNRPFKKRSRQYYVTIFLLVFLISLILFFAGQFLPIAVVLAVGFLSYVLSVVPPTLVKHQIRTYGMMVEGQPYTWDEMGRFWFEEKLGHNVLQIEVFRFPGRVMLLLGEIKPEDMAEVLRDVLIEQRPPLTFFERAADWLQQKLPLDMDR